MSLECIWSMSIPHSASWTIRKIFKLREKVQPWIKYIVGNGWNTFLCLDNWHPSSPLKTCFGSRMDQNLLTSISAQVSAIICNNSWFWDRNRSHVAEEILDGIPPNMQPNSTQEDTCYLVFKPKWQVLN